MSATDIASTLERINSLLTEIEDKLTTVVERHVPALEMKFSGLRRVTTRLLSMFALMELPPSLSAQHAIIDNTIRKLLMLWATWNLIQMGTPWGLIAAAGTLTMVAMGGLGDINDALKGNTR